jgi:N-acetylmuramoyl-L-alanine amidase
VRGASGLIDEVDEARKVVPAVVNDLKLLGAEVVEFHDDVSTTQSENLNRIVNFHNGQTRDLDVSVHFNAYQPTDGGRGTECLYITQETLAARVAQAIAETSGLINRGAHKRSDLYFLNGTTEPSILIEVCFVDAAADVECYQAHFDGICRNIAAALLNLGDVSRPGVLRARGKVSWFGGPDDTGVSPSEGLAFIYEVEDKPHLFLKSQPQNTTGLARRLDPGKHYIAMRWDYDLHSKDMLAGKDIALVRAVKNGREIEAHPADWGPHVDTGRVADVSPEILEQLQIETDDEVEVVYPYHKRSKRKS